MSFISLSTKYYGEKLEEYENKRLSEQELYEAKQLLKLLDDLADEGETDLNDQMEADFLCITRLRGLLQKYGTVPFPIDHERLPDTSYGTEEYELEELLGRLAEKAGRHSGTSPNAFLSRIRQYSEWIGYREDTAYVFLLRDSLLPYLFFRSCGRQDIYPWLLSRSSLSEIAGTENVDEEIRLPLCEALENGHTEYDDFSSYCRDRIVPVLDGHPALKSSLLQLLGPIRKDHIVVVESGYMGTMLMLLKALDERVDIRLYTTAPFLYETYRDKTFCRRYEEIRNFETVYSHDLLLRYSSWRSGKFYVNISEDESVKNRSLAEMKYFLR